MVSYKVVLVSVKSLPPLTHCTDSVNGSCARYYHLERALSDFGFKLNAAKHCLLVKHVDTVTLAGGSVRVGDVFSEEGNSSIITQGILMWHLSYWEKKCACLNIIW